MGGRSPVWQEEEGSTIPQGGELLPPLEVEHEVGMTSSREATEELRSIILLRKVLPARTTLAAKLRMPAVPAWSSWNRLPRCPDSGVCHVVYQGGGGVKECA